MRKLSVSFRVDFSPRCSIGPGKIALLEHIRDDGSLSAAARSLRMSYRRAWLLLDDLNSSFQEPVAQISVGGRGGGGGTLTRLGTDLVVAYRDLQEQFHVMARQAFPAAARPSTEKKPDKRVPRRRLSRKSP